MLKRLSSIISQSRFFYGERKFGTRVTNRDKWWRRSGSARNGFRYFDANGRQIVDDAQLDRIDKLVIPPAWRNVRICPRPGGRSQAVGIDKLGRQQYIYHPTFVLKQQKAKYARLERFGRALPALRQLANEHIDLPGPCRLKVLAVVIRLINDLYFRVGSE